MAFPSLRLGQAAETPLRHLILLMRENRSFDHYFGHFPGADGLPAGARVSRATSPCVPSPPHDESAFHSLSEAPETWSSAALTCFTEQDVPQAWTLASRFTLCDRYFASVLGPTFPNRLFSIAASAGGYEGNPERIDQALLPRPTLVDRLDAARVDWACYLARRPDAMYNPVTYYAERRDDARANRSFADFLDDARRGRLPAVSWVVPQDPLTEHPPSPPQWGQRFADLAVHAVASGPQWRESAMILNYDESGGFYDHVAPPHGGDAQLGYRVPCTVVSPFARAGHVSHAVYDHASVLALAERVFGLSPLTGRDAAADPFEDCFDFQHPTWEPPPLSPPPPAVDCARLPAWAAELMEVPAPAGPPAAGVAAAAAGAGVGLAGGAALTAYLWRRRHDDSSAAS